MKRFMFCCAWITVSVVWGFPVFASFDFHKNLTFVKINSNPTLKFESKPSSLKLASVQFLSDSNRISFDKGEVDVKTECASLGFVIPISECKSPMVPSYLCSSELSREGAANYTTGCCNSNLYTAATMDSCTNNATALDDSCYWGGSKKYRCACDRSRYPYSELEGEGCGSNGDFNVNNKCMAPDATGKQVSYYTNCCPTSYEECDASKHMVGSGNSCRVETSKGNIIHKYEECVCSSNYQTPCSGNMLIDGSDYCRYNNTIYTRENNCESSCDQTRETNVDSYLYNNVWHCLYSEEGAIIKSGESGLCKGYTALKELEEEAFYDCSAQGFTKSEDDCYIKDAILRCPTDTSKVWCLDSKYCTGYDVGKIGNVSACNDGAKITKCPSLDTEKGVRCSYTNDECNKCWTDGTYTASRCQNLDTSDKGDSEKCCKRGYKMVNGVCQPNICDKTRFPYTNNPGSDMGEQEVCYEANSSQPLGYTAHFGYASCNSDVTKGGMWMHDSANSRRCVCIRNNEDNKGRAYLPFDIDTFFKGNGEGGFNQGSYGEAVNCTDGEGSYYGYSSCYVGTYMGTGSNAGKCLAAGCVNYVNGYPYDSSWYVTEQINQIGYSVRGGCVNYYTHCETRDGRKVGDASACALVPAGCLTGREAACNTCYDVSSVEVGADGLYKAHGLFKARMNYCRNSSVFYGFESCPPNFRKGRTYSTCYKYCYTSDPSKCVSGDILIDGSNKIGLVYHVSGRTLYLLSLSYGWDTWYNAPTWASNYAPSGYENHAVWGKGKWKLPSWAESPTGMKGYWSTFRYHGSLAGEGLDGYDDTWTTNSLDANNARYMTATADAVSKSSSKRIRAIKIWTY